ncbi:hypothetical protein HBB16_19275 [Pseudonocardia sp. MCCB 268]|nr:hypothetical protein [Pseudonocardia cytotoxica]
MARLAVSSRRGGAHRVRASTAAAARRAGREPARGDALSTTVDDSTACAVLERVLRRELAGCRPGHCLNNALRGTPRAARAPGRVPSRSSEPSAARARRSARPVTGRTDAGLSCDVRSKLLQR